MPDVTYFPNVQLNFAENLLRHAAPGSPLENAEAVVSISESRGEDKRWTFAELRDDAARVRAALGALGVTTADACGAYMPNVGETIVEMVVKQPNLEDDLPPIWYNRFDDERRVLTACAWPSGAAAKIPWRMSTTPCVSMNPKEAGCD